MSKNPSKILEIQAKCIDIAIGGIRKRLSWTGKSEDEAYKECVKQAQIVDSRGVGYFGSKSRLLRASNIMCVLAHQEASQWLEDSRQNEEGSLPVLTINPGGHPRSAGSRVETLQPVFQEVLQSPGYQNLEEAA